MSGEIRVPGDVSTPSVGRPTPRCSSCRATWVQLRFVKAKGAWFCREGRTCQRRIAARVAVLGYGRGEKRPTLGPLQARVLRALDETDWTRGAALAERFGRASATVYQALTALERRGLVERSSQGARRKR